MSSMSMGVTFLYQSGMTLEAGNAYLAAGVALSGMLFSTFIYRTWARIMTRREEQEISTVLETGAGFAPRHQPLRPLQVPGSLGTIGMGIGAVNYAYSIQPQQIQNIVALSGLGIAASGLFWVFDIMCSYFMDTTFHPPSAKKSLRNWAYEKLLGKVPAPAVPEEVKQHTYAG